MALNVQQSPAPVLSDDTRGPLVNIAIWVALIAATLAAALKVIIKYHAVKTLGLDDWTLVGAWVLAIGQVAAIGIQVNNGLGSHRSTLSEDQLDKFFKARYANEILYAIGIFITKLTPLYFFPAISATPGCRQLMQLGTIFVWLWTFACLFVTAFSCRLPRPWQIENSQCINMPAFWGIFTVIDILTQLTISLLPIFLLRHVQMTQRWKKVFSMLCFTPNALTVPVTILRYIYLLHQNSYLSSHSTVADLTWYTFNYTLLTGLHPHLALIFASTSFIKPFVDSLVVIPQVVGSPTVSSTRYPYPHGIFHPGSNFTSSVISTSRKQKRSRGRSLLGLGGGAGSGGSGGIGAAGGGGGKEASERGRVGEVVPGTYIHLDERERLTPDLRGGGAEGVGRDVGREERGTGSRPWGILKTVTASVSSEPRGER